MKWRVIPRKKMIMSHVAKATLDGARTVGFGGATCFLGILGGGWLGLIRGIKRDCVWPVSMKAATSTPRWADWDRDSLGTVEDDDTEVLVTFEETTEEEVADELEELELDVLDELDEEEELEEEEADVSCTCWATWAAKRASRAATWGS
jgi:hypothetical protein